MVSKVCHSQLSSSTLARAAHMPPCAAPVCDRVGYSFVSTAVRARLPDSMAARMPAPPAPTITTSYLWNCISARLLSAHVRIKSKDHQRADAKDQDHRR